MASHQSTKQTESAPSGPNLPHRSSSNAHYASRRPPAHRSVSLLHSASKLGSNPASDEEPSKTHTRQTSSLTSQAAPQSDVANPPSTSPASSKLKHNQRSSGESSDAGRWFENTNNDGPGTNKFSPDDDPPFFLRNSSSSQTPPDAPKANELVYIQQLPDFRKTELMHMGTDGSSDDYRSVIDDLTIANKKLKRKLKRYEKMYDGHLQEDKLFEVRFHGLPAHKKAELEETLRKFAMSIDDPVPGRVSRPASESITTGTGATSQVNYAPQLKPHNTASSHTSRFAESGYASMSTSGQGNSSVPLGQDTSSKKDSKSAWNIQDSDIQSYLHDIPAGLLPKGNTLAMTEKSKKKLVVRRLEQIFAGKGAAVGGHQQPIQQQEVAQSAARADRRDQEAAGQAFRQEGLREAKIMPNADGTEMDTDQHSESTQNFGPAVKIVLQDSTGTSSPDQRPTRPLDLDPQRAQVPMENADYFRHLGFTPPDWERSPLEGHGWIYLNLLVNMAQLHTINVTVDFVKKAVNEYSSKLELSPDGRKVRWRGGQNVTRTSSHGSSSTPGDTSPDTGAEGTGVKRVKTGKRHGESSDPLKRAQKLAKLEQEKDRKFNYTPLFFHREESSDDEEDSHLVPSTLSSPVPAHDSSAFASSGVRTSSSKRRRDDGPLIFYTRAKFCTDLSGNTSQSGVKPDTAYEPFTQYPVGSSPEATRTTGGPAERRDITGAFRTVADDIEMADMGFLNTPQSNGSDFNFSLKSLENNAGSTKLSSHHVFEASGLGGVQPDDNFAIHVVSRNSAHPMGEAASAKVDRRIHLPAKLHQLLSSNRKGAGADTSVSEEILSTTTKPLPASTLPPASFLPLGSSSGDADSDDGGEDSDASEDDDVSISSAHAQPRVGRQPMFNIRDDSSSEEESSEDEDDDEEDEESASVDLLATARQLDPAAVRAREREYDSNIAERLAEDIPAGSSAATAGGGSGFNTPATNIDVDRRERGASLKRARTSDSMVVPGKAPKLE